MTPKKYIKFTFRDAVGNLLETPECYKTLAEAWNSQEGVSDVSEELTVLVVDEPESPDEVGDENDDGPIGDMQP